MSLPVGRRGPTLIVFSLLLTVKKKCSTGLKLSNLMNLGRKKSTSLEPPERSLETSSKTPASAWASSWYGCGDGEPRQRRQRTPCLESTQSWGLGYSPLWVGLYASPGSVLLQYWFL